MQPDPFTLLETEIASSARQRDIRFQKSRDVRLAQEQQRDEARAIWLTVERDLPGIVAAIDGMLKRHNYAGIMMGKYDLKHHDIGRALLEFEHNERNHSKIILYATSSGEFICLIRFITGEEPVSTTKLAALTSTVLKQIVGDAVVKCLNSESLPRKEVSTHPEDATR